MQTYFITGTDTGVGKTYASCVLLKEFAAQGLQTQAIKPVASGAEKLNQNYVNDDALQLQQVMTLNLEYAQVNPILFQEPIAPHIAAANQGVELSVDSLIQATKALIDPRADVCIIEGAGGWLVPLNSKQTYADYVREMNIPVILVVGMQLGCLNHALLTCSAIQKSGVKLAGWIANSIFPDFIYQAENTTTLQQHIAEPYLGMIAYNGEALDCGHITGLKAKTKLV